MVKYVSKIAHESLVDIYGMIKAVDAPITVATQQDIEISVTRIYTVSLVAANRLPFDIEDASRSEQDIQDSKSDEKCQFSGGVGQDVRLDNRWIDLRTTTNHATFRIQGGVCRFYREYLLGQGFIEIHSPKMVGLNEGGIDLFTTRYFGSDAFLARSPQLYKQMALSCDLQKVFEIGPAFRSEKSCTHRHLCEFTGLDMEMEFKEHYHEVLNTLGNLLIYIFNQLNKHYKEEIEAVRKQYPFEDMVYGKQMLILTFAEAHGMIKKYYLDLLRDGSQESVEEAKNLLFEGNDFSKPMEKKLGELVKAKYGIEFYCVDKYPLSERPFYTMHDSFDKTLSNSYDIFVRGEEILSGAQRIHDYKILTEKAKAHNISVESLQTYIDSFKYATPPHAGGCVGLERLVMAFLKLDDIRKASLFPRDPKKINP